jgi:uncharacterized protein YxjI
MDPLERFAHPTYTVRKKVFNFLSTGFHIFDPDDNLAMYCKMKGFKLKEDIRLYTDESLGTEVLTIQADRVIDISASYTVKDSATGESVGALKRAGFKSMLRDEWLVFDSNGSELGKIMEDSTLKALARRFIGLVSLFMPQKYHVDFNGQTVCTMQQTFNPFLMKLVVDFTPDTDNQLDPRLGLAAAVLLCAIEGKQK